MRQFTSFCLLLFVCNVQFCGSSYLCSSPRIRGLVAECHSPQGLKIDCEGPLLPGTIIALNCEHNYKATPVETTRQICSEVGLWTGHPISCLPVQDDDRMATFMKGMTESMEAIIENKINALVINELMAKINLLIQKEEETASQINAIKVQTTYLQTENTVISDKLEFLEKKIEGTEASTTNQLKSLQISNGAAALRLQYTQENSEKNIVHKVDKAVEQLSLLFNNITHQSCILNDNQDNLSTTLSSPDSEVKRTNTNQPSETAFTGLFPSTTESRKEFIIETPTPGPSIEGDKTLAQMEMDRALIEASKGGRLEEVESLLKRGVDATSAKDKDGNTALHWASLGGHLEVVKLLLDQGVPMKGNVWGRTPLNWAARGGHLEVSSLLLQRGAKVQEKDLSGDQAIHVASYWGHVELVRLFLDKGANLEDRGLFNYTPLHCAARRGQVDLIRFLLQRGASTNSRDYSGSTPAEVAMQWNHGEAHRLLLNME